MRCSQRAQVQRSSLGLCEVVTLHRSSLPPSDVTKRTVRGSVMVMFWL